MTDDLYGAGPRARDLSAPTAPYETPPRTAAAVALPYPGAIGGLRGLVRWPSWLLALAGLLMLGFGLRIGAALLWPRIHHADELFQYMEQAHRLAFGQGVVPWEYREGVRSWLLPGLLAGIMELVEPLSDGPMVYLVVIKLLFSAVSLAIVAVAFLWARRVAGVVAGLTAACIATVWFELIYFAPTTLTESIATTTLVLGCYLAATAGDDRRSATRLAQAGLCLGLAFVLRFHLAPALLVAAAVACGTDWRGRWRPMMLGALVPVLALGLLDWATLGWPFQSVLKNFWINIVEEKSHSFGVMPLGFYLGEYLAVWSWWAIPMVALAALGARGQRMLALVPLAIVLSHSLVAHKEYRFIFPALPFLLILAGIGTVRAARTIADIAVVRRDAVLGGALVLWAAASALLAVGDRWVWEWSRGAPGIAVAAELRQDTDLCGVGLMAPWWDLPGYTYLHRDVPMIWFENQRRLAEAAPSFNYLVARPGQVPRRWGYLFDDCPGGGDLCIYRRPGRCTPPEGPTVSNAMAERGM